MYADAVKLRTGLRGKRDLKPFVRSVEVKEGQQKPVIVFDGLLAVFWGLMLAKCILCTWAVGYWDMPISSFWVWLPSMIFGAVCTFLYVYRE